MTVTKKAQSTKSKVSPELLVFYDSECMICWHKMQKYKKLLPRHTQFIDIQAANFSAKAYGLKPALVKKHLHIRYNGKTLMGMPAIAVLWSLSPKTHHLAKLAQNPFAYQVLDFGYHQFSKVRPWLPKRSQSACSDDYCEI